jgi:hypothetical protein
MTLEGEREGPKRKRKRRPKPKGKLLAISSNKDLRSAKPMRDTRHASNGDTRSAAPRDPHNASNGNYWSATPVWDPRNAPAAAHSSTAWAAGPYDERDLEREREHGRSGGAHLSASSRAQAAGPSRSYSSRAPSPPREIHYLLDPPPLPPAGGFPVWGRELEPGPDAASGGFTIGEDFIPFDFSDDEKEEGKDVTPVVSPGKGKGKGRDLANQDARSVGGVKRMLLEMEDDDGYANKKQRTDAASRLTPWIDYVKWDNCRNLAELYVYCSNVCAC